MAGGATASARKISSGQPEQPYPETPAAELRQDAYAAHQRASGASPAAPPFSVPLPIVTDVSADSAEYPGPDTAFSSWPNGCGNQGEICCRIHLWGRQQCRTGSLRPRRMVPGWTQPGRQRTGEQPEVGQVLAQSNYRNLELDSGGQEQKKKQTCCNGISDCENRLLLTEVNEQLRQLQQNYLAQILARAVSLEKFQTLNRRKNDEAFLLLRFCRPAVATATPVVSG